MNEKKECYRCGKEAPIPILGGAKYLCRECDDKRKRGDFVRGL